MNEKKLIVIVGPTAVGKTALSIQLAKALKTEIISADSRQIYKELSIGTAKPSAAELQMVPHHFIGTKSIHEEYSAGEYGRDALALLSDLFKKFPIVVACGGSGLYIKALCEGLDDMPAVPPGTREKIMAEYAEKGLTWLQEQVAFADPDYASVIDMNNPHRLVRALELHYTTGMPPSSFRQSKKRKNNFEIVKIGLELDREHLYQRIDNRMDDMVLSGLFSEAEGLVAVKELNALRTVGYQEIFSYLNGEIDKDEAIRLMKRNTRHYAKRQMTWFKKDATVRWFAPAKSEEVFSYATLAVTHER